MSLRNKVRSGRYGLVLVAVSGGMALAAVTPNGNEAFGKVYSDPVSASNDAVRKFGKEPGIVVSATDWNALTVTELRSRAREKGIKGYSKLPKPKLVELLAA